MENIIIAAILGLIEGVTEFLPVSSTAHLLLASHFFHFSALPHNVFEVIIQFAAILAVCVVYWPRVWSTVVGLPNERKAQRFTGLILLGFLPAMVLGAGLHGIIKEALFNPTVIAWALMIGGFVIVVVEWLPLKPKVTSVDDIPFKTALKIGFCQAFAMIPGVSRSGATIIGAMLLGVERKAAMEFSFFLAIPTMLAATTLDVYQNWTDIAAAKDSALILAVGLLSAFVSALIVVRAMITLIGRYGFAPFGWYRIVFGLLLLWLV